MTRFTAALPMYDWPEERAATDAWWARLRDRLRKAGVDAPERLSRRNADVWPHHDDPDGLDLEALWRHPGLLFAQTCWGPMEAGLAQEVAVLGQPDYSAFEGGEGTLYRSAILMRRDLPMGDPPHKGEGKAAVLPLDRLKNQRLAFNGPDSMSGILALTRDLSALGENLSIFSEKQETGSHRGSIRAVAEGRADVCAIDCGSWALGLKHEPAAAALAPVGWTGARPGLPYIASRHLDEATIETVRSVLAALDR